MTRRYDTSLPANLRSLKEEIEGYAREYGLDLLITAPSVEYHVFTTDGASLNVDNPALLPPPNHIQRLSRIVL